MKALFRLIVVTVMLLGSAGVSAKRPPLRPIFGPALRWSMPQPKSQIATAKRFCGRLRGRTLPPRASELKSPPIPEWPMLRWGMRVSNVRGALARAGWPMRIHCFAKTGTPYLELRRRLSSGVGALPGASWKVTLYFRSAAPLGLSGILMETSGRWTPAQAAALVRAAMSHYGRSASQRKSITRREKFEEYHWIRSAAKIALRLRYNRKTGLYDIWFRYNPRR